jgi:uncharacterized protein YaiI (UPF0178 family)
VRILLDADACPVKEQVYKVAARYGVELAVVANSPLRVPAGVRLVIVPGGVDAADDWITEQAVAGDLVLTADVPLAARVVGKGARCLDFRGGEFSTSRIGDALAARDLNAYLRSLGLTGPGPAALSPRDRSRFASALDSAVQQARAAARRSLSPAPEAGMREEPDADA